jgi:hypothetical protein
LTTIEQPLGTGQKERPVLFFQNIFPAGLRDAAATASAARWRHVGKSVI